MNQRSPENLVNYKTFYSFLDEKADKKELENQMNEKSNVEDMLLNLNVSTTIHKQLKNVGILVLEILRRDLLKYEESRKTKNCWKREATEILEQATSVIKWINRYNPEDISQKNCKTPNEIKDLQNFKGNALVII